MKFTVDCETNIGRGPSFRLTAAGNWRELSHNNQIIEGDAVFVNADDAAAKAASFSAVEYQGKRYDARNEFGIVYGQTERVATVFPRIHRSTRPHCFSIAEVQAAIASGDDSHRNVVVVDTGGHVRLLDLSDESLHQGYQSDPRIAAAYSIFQAGNDYVGPDAASDHRQVSDVYTGLLADWVDHLRTGKMNRHDEDRGPLGEAAMLQEISRLLQGLA